MKLEKKKQARTFRRQGKSITWIADILNVSKGSVSLWVRDIELDATLLKKIKARSHTTVAIEKRRRARIENSACKKEKIVNAAKVAQNFSGKKDLFVAGVALYWGEGSKRKQNVLEFTNSDPTMIRTMMKFFTFLCRVPSDKFRGHVYVHSHIDHRQAEKYWSGVSGIPLTQFHKTSIQKNAGKVSKDTLPFGTFAIVVCDTEKKLKMDGWIKAMAESF